MIFWSYDTIEIYNLKYSAENFQLEAETHINNLRQQKGPNILAKDTILKSKFIFMFFLIFQLRKEELLLCIFGCSLFLKQFWWQ